MRRSISSSPRSSTSSSCSASRVTPMFKADGAVNMGVTREALQLLEVDERGLDEMDRRMLEALIQRYDGGPVGLQSLAVVLGEDTGTLEDVYEPFLVQE